MECRLLHSSLYILALLLCSCHMKNHNKTAEERANYPEGTFGYDHHFVSDYYRTIVLSDKDSGARILVSPDLQGRVLTSTFDGADGESLGYFNHSRVASKKIQPHSQGYGGEDRFWIGPQGGQYTIFFHPGDPFDFDHWFTPKGIDREPFKVISTTDTSISLRQEMTAVNYSGFPFQLKINRKISLISRAGAKAYLGLTALDSTLKYVGFQSENALINAGTIPWTKETGLLSIWILGQFPAGATIVIPFAGGRDQKVYNEYFKGLTPPLTGQQVKVDQNVIYYNGNGHEIGKIGLQRQYVRPFFGSYNSHTQVLTIIQYAFDQADTAYVNSLWKRQQHPYSGDVINAYNDGPLDTTARFAPTFYELESSSPARQLQPGEHLSHYHRTFHFKGDEQQLNKISSALLGTTIDRITEKFNTP